MVPVSQRGSRQFREALLAGFATRGHLNLIHSSYAQKIKPSIMSLSSFFIWLEIL